MYVNTMVVQKTNELLVDFIKRNASDAPKCKVHAVSAVYLLSVSSTAARYSTPVGSPRTSIIGQPTESKQKVGVVGVPHPQDECVTFTIHQAH